MTNENTINNKEILKEEQLDSVAGGGGFDLIPPPWEKGYGRKDEMLKQEKLDVLAFAGTFDSVGMNSNAVQNEIFIIPTNNEPKKNIKVDDAIRG